MLIKFGGIISEGRGKQGGVVYSRNTYGAYIRTKVSPTNPSTTAQQAVRAGLTSISQAWRGLSDTARAGFESLAREVSRTNIFGDNVAYTGFNLFGRLGRNIQVISGTPLTAAPAIPTMSAVTSLTLTAKVAAGLVSLAYTPDPVPTGFDMVIQATPQVSQGINFVKSEYRQLAVVAAAASSPYVGTTAYAAKFGVPVLGKRIFMRAKLVHIASGFESLWLQTSTIVVAS
jgi:hypothetical protein